MKICNIEGCEKKVMGAGLCSMHYNRKRRYGDVETVSKAANGSTYAWIKEHSSFSSDDCLIWPFARKKRCGYGKATHNGRSIVASRLMCIEAHGPAPDSTHDAAHSCGNGHLGCVNPRHLRWATHQENMSDAIGHGTVTRGEQRWNARLSETDVARIRRLVASGSTQRSMAKEYGVSFDAISKVCRGKTWAHVPLADVETTLRGWDVPLRGRAA